MKVGHIKMAPTAQNPQADGELELGAKGYAHLLSRLELGPKLLSQVCKRCFC
jgi:hypothetical protein